MEYLHVLAKKWRYFLFLSFLKGKKKRKKSGNQMKSKISSKIDSMKRESGESPERSRHCNS